MKHSPSRPRIPLPPHVPADSAELARRRLLVESVLSTRAEMEPLGFDVLELLKEAEEEIHGSHG